MEKFRIQGQSRMFNIKPHVEPHVAFKSSVILLEGRLRITLNCPFGLKSLKLKVSLEEAVPYHEECE